MTVNRAQLGMSVVKLLRTKLKLLLQAERSGSIAVEAAFAMVLLMAILLPLVDFGGYIGTRLELKQALRAGGQYALNDFADTATIASVIGQAASLKAVSVNFDSPNTYCLCNDGSGGSCLGDAGFRVCSDGVIAGRFMKIHASAAYDPFFPFLAWFAPNMTVTEQLTLRVQ